MYWLTPKKAFRLYVNALQDGERIEGDLLHVFLEHGAVAR